MTEITEEAPDVDAACVLCLATTPCARLYEDCHAACPSVGVSHLWPSDRGWPPADAGVECEGILDVDVCRLELAARFDRWIALGCEPRLDPLDRLEWIEGAIASFCLMAEATFDPTWVAECLGRIHEADCEDLCRDAGRPNSGCSPSDSARLGSCSKVKQRACPPFVDICPGQSC